MSNVLTVTITILLAILLFWGSCGSNEKGSNSGYEREVDIEEMERGEPFSSR